MRRVVTSLLCIVFPFALLDAQSLEVGLRDNQFGHAAYVSKKGLFAGYEQSMLNVKMKEQCGRLFAGYTYVNANWNIIGASYFCTEYNGSWHSYGISIQSEYRWHRLYLAGILNPNYDSGLDFDFCYQAEAGLSLWERAGSDERVELCASYGNVPEYRMPVENYRIGFKFSSGNLWVKPMICFPLPDQESGSKYMRVLCSFGWMVKMKR